jgi:hypothetical protein
MSHYQEQGYLTWLPDWSYDAALFFAAILAIYAIGTHPDVKKQCIRAYNYNPKMLLMILLIVGAGVGASMGAFGYWTIQRQQQKQGTASIANQAKTETARAAQQTLGDSSSQETKVAKPEPNLLPVGYRKLFIGFNPATQTFIEADKGIPAVVALFTNDTERGKTISEAKEIRARIIFEPSEFYEKLNKGINDAEKTTTGFASVVEGIWLNERQSVVHFSRGETKTLIIAIQMQGDLGFGGFEGFGHSTSIRDGMEIFLPKIPILTADKYFVKVVLSGGESGDISELFHCTLLLRPEFKISR